MKVCRLLVDEESVRRPDEVDVLRPHHQFLQVLGRAQPNQNHHLRNIKYSILMYDKFEEKIVEVYKKCKNKQLSYVKVAF